MRYGGSAQMEPVYASMARQDFDRCLETKGYRKVSKDFLVDQCAVSKGEEDEAEEGRREAEERI